MSKNMELMINGVSHNLFHNQENYKMRNCG